MMGFFAFKYLQSKKFILEWSYQKEPAREANND